MKPRRKPARQTELFGRQVEEAQWKARILERLDEEGEDEFAAKLRSCGQPMSLWCAECGHRHECKTKCSRKWCPSCGPKRGNERAARLRVLIASMRWPLHITLTVPNVVADWAPRTLLKDLLESFRRLRRTKLWKENVEGGAYGIEITDKGHGYHPHLHIVADCRWLALTTKAPHHTDTAERVAAKFRNSMSELQAAWQHATRIDRHMSLFLRRCDSNAASEILKYALKSEDACKLEGRLGPVFRLIDSVRMCSPFGSIRGVKIPPDEEHKLTCPNGHDKWTASPTIGRAELERRWSERAAKRRAEREYAAAYDAAMVQAYADLTERLKRTP